MWMTLAQSENDAHVEIESDGESDAHESYSSCLDESSDVGNTREKSFFNEAKAVMFFALFSQANPPRKIHATCEVKLSVEEWNILKTT